MDNKDWDEDSICSLLQRKFPKNVKLDHSLKEHNTFQTGGKAKIFFDATSTELLSELLKTVHLFDFPIFILGGGSNLLVSENGFNGLVIKNSIKSIRHEDSLLYCGAGESLQDLIDYASDNGLSGLEFATGIWGTVGGAIYGNAGAYGGEIKNVLTEVELVDRQGNIIVRQVDELKFDYRWSVFKETGEYITSAKFALKPGKVEEIRHKVDEIMSVRLEKLPYDKNSAGCIFKNIPDPKEKFGKLSAGKLLEESSAKTMNCGGARVSEKHANIIVNDGGADSDDIKKLADLLKEKVFSNFGIELQEEIILLGKFN